ncbi:toll/interleukin-1 receptor domain-containing protein [Bradyrhizobium sp. CCBAU 21360]|uniref:toll/interleukin-1 receptor domain-containing protein n=1 Tax=Bradyrhizobium sp. CCBAU 21360 TaxID=1325081 RepID=UPI002305EB74|nr:toll/interleukin-1 receptor domain-containing protein [Bradyrhizobium sp. CCBAU 21360]
MKAIVHDVATEVRNRLNAVRHPVSGEFPTVVVSGDSLESLSFRVEGTPEVLALVRERFGQEDLALMDLREASPKASPRAFLSYAWEDRELAKRLATALMAKGIDTWWAEWSMRSGDSLRQKIDQGLANCTHFLVLLTPTSIEKPWVNQEMDAGLIRKLEENARFIAIRSELPASRLPPLLKGMLAPALDDFDNDVDQIIADIHELSRKPALGPLPAAASAPATGYSAAASAVARIFVDKSEHAVFGDPQLTFDDIARAVDLTKDDVKDALHELSTFFTISFDRALPKNELFATFDGYFKEWTPSTDALSLAADLVNDPHFPENPPEIAERYGWTTRRLNSAIAYLANRELVMESQGLGTHPWGTAWIQKTDATRRFVKSRSSAANSS